MAQIHFFGATRQVTGSQHLLELPDGMQILIDCGTDMQNKNKKKRLFAMPPASIDVVLLTHAHIDHSGLLPLLVDEGFDGPVYATTFQLTRILLRDAARLNMKKFGRRREKPDDYYDEKMVERIWDQFITIDFGVKQSLGNQASFIAWEAGHLLGAASLRIEWNERSSPRSILFTGDIGRENDPLLPNPVLPPPSDYIVSESTYGGRLHLDTGSREDRILEIIRETCVAQPGRLIVPAFSVGRTQSFLYILNQLNQKGLLPALPVFTDSPLAKRSSRIYEDFQPFLNAQARVFGDHHGSLFDFDKVTYLPDMNSAEQIRNYHEPCIILTSSGMVRGGKSEDHVIMNLQNPFCTILFIGYCAEGTLGHILLEGKTSVRTDRDRIPVNARIESTDLFSGHADHNGLLNYLKETGSAQGRIFLTHGEVNSMEALGSSLQDEGFQVAIPFEHQNFFLE